VLVDGSVAARVSDRERGDRRQHQREREQRDGCHRMEGTGTGHTSTVCAGHQKAAVTV
jgi:hypothetical protein